MQKAESLAPSDFLGSPPPPELLAIRWARSKMINGKASCLGHQRKELRHEIGIKLAIRRPSSRIITIRLASCLVQSLEVDVVRAQKRLTRASRSSFMLFAAKL